MKRFPVRFACALFALYLFLTTVPVPCSSAGIDCKKRIALTFDDGPHVRHTEEILDLLSRYGVKATFFIIGVNACRYPEIVAREAREGHEIGNHTFSHRSLARLSAEEIAADLTRTSRILYAICHTSPKIFRPPEGVRTAAVRAASEKAGLALVYWTIDTRDWAHAPTDAILSSVRKGAKDGAIILCHDFVSGECHTREALSVLIPELLSRGFEFVTVSELLQ